MDPVTFGRLRDIIRMERRAYKNSKLCANLAEFTGETKYQDSAILEIGLARGLRYAAEVLVKGI